MEAERERRLATLIAKDEIRDVLMRRGDIRERDPAAQFRKGAVAENEKLLREKLGAKAVTSS